MKNNHKSLSLASLISAFLMGVILFWSFGKNWLDLESILVILGGLIGVTLVVILWRAWDLHHPSTSDQKQSD